MKGHVYCKHIANKNLQGFIVGGVPFKRLFEAEEYCARLDLPPSKDFLAYSPAEAKSLSLICEKELKYVVDLLEDEQKKAGKKLDTLRNERNRILGKNKINILDECSLTVLNDDMGKAIGEVSGLTTAIMLIRKRGYEHWEVSRLEGKENVETT